VGERRMPFEIISGFAGATIAEFVSKFLPARKAGQMGEEFLRIHEHRISGYIAVYWAHSALVS
jgi:hypothetical protein